MILPDYLWVRIEYKRRKSLRNEERAVTYRNFSSLKGFIHELRVFVSKKGDRMYIDPNTGGILFQALAGLLAVFSGVMLVFSRNIRQWIARLRRGSRKDDEDTK